MVNMANGPDVQMGFISLEFTTGSSDCEGALVAGCGYGGGDGGGSGFDMENRGGVYERRGEMG